MLSIRHSIGKTPLLEHMANDSKSVAHFRCYAIAPPPGVYAHFALSMGRINMGQRTVTDERLVSVHCEELMLGSGKVLRIPCLDCFERQDALPQIAVDHRIIAPVDHCSQTLGGKLVGGVVAHP